MMERRTFIGLGLGTLAGASALMLAACGVARPIDGPRYRLSVVVDTPQGERTGSSVVEARWVMQSFVVNGEAVAVDVAPGQTLFVLLRSANDVDWAARVGNNIAPDDDTPPLERMPWAEREKVIAADRGVWPVRRRVPDGYNATTMIDNYPYFVRFRNIADPKSVEQVDPDGLTKSFGAGVKLKSFTVQVTEEPVTSGIEKRLKWLGVHPEPSLDSGHGPDDWTIAATLRHGDFRKEITK